MGSPWASGKSSPAGSSGPGPPPASELAVMLQRFGLTLAQHSRRRKSLSRAAAEARRVCTPLRLIRPGTAGAWGTRARRGRANRDDAVGPGSACVKLHLRRSASAHCLHTDSGPSSAPTSEARPARPPACTPPWQPASQHTEVREDAPRAGEGEQAAVGARCTPLGTLSSLGACPRPAARGPSASCPPGPPPALSLPAYRRAHSGDNASPNASPNPAGPPVPALQRDALHQVSGPQRLAAESRAAESAGPCGTPGATAACSNALGCRGMAATRARTPGRPCKKETHTASDAAPAQHRAKVRATPRACSMYAIPLVTAPLAPPAAAASQGVAGGAAPWRAAPSTRPAAAKQPAAGQPTRQAAAARLTACAPLQAGAPAAPKQPGGLEAASPASALAPQAPPAPPAARGPGGSAGAVEACGMHQRGLPSLLCGCCGCAVLPHSARVPGPGSVAAPPSPSCADAPAPARECCARRRAGEPAAGLHAGDSIGLHHAKCGPELGASESRARLGCGSEQGGQAGVPAVPGSRGCSGWEAAAHALADWRQQLTSLRIHAPTSVIGYVAGLAAGGSEPGLPRLACVGWLQQRRSTPDACMQMHQVNSEEALDFATSVNGVALARSACEDC